MAIDSSFKYDLRVRLSRMFGLMPRLPSGPCARRLLIASRMHHKRTRQGALVAACCERSLHFHTRMRSIWKTTAALRYQRRECHSKIEAIKKTDEPARIDRVLDWPFASSTINMKTFATLLCLGNLVFAASSSPIARRDLSSDTENQLTDGTACRDMTIIFARGTFETGNVGTYAGPQFFQAVANLTGESKFAVQGVEYPADTHGFFAGGDPTGSQTMANLVAQAQTQCPDTKVVMSGYSQGGQLVHNAAKLLNSTQSDNINSGERIQARLAEGREG